MTYANLLLGLVHICIEAESLIGADSRGERSRADSREQEKQHASKAEKRRERPCHCVKVQNLGDADEEGRTSHAT